MIIKEKRLMRFVYLIFFGTINKFRIEGDTKHMITRRYH